MAEKENFYLLPEKNEASRAFGSYLFTFQRGWPDWFPEISQVIEDDLGDDLRGYFGKDYELFSTEFARKKFVAGPYHQEAYSNYWHFDWRGLMDHGC